MNAPVASTDCIQCKSARLWPIAYRLARRIPHASASITDRKAAVHAWALAVLRALWEE